MASGMGLRLVPIGSSNLIQSAVAGSDLPLLGRERREAIYFSERLGTIGSGEKRLGTIALRLGLARQRCGGARIAWMSLRPFSSVLFLSAVGESAS
jgi:hypothetical protein